MNSVTNSKYFATIAVISTVAIAGCTVSYFAGKSSSKVSSTYQYMLSEPVSAGSDISDKVVKVTVPSNQALDPSETISSIDELEGMVAKTDMVKYQPVTKDCFIATQSYKEDIDRNLDFAMPTSVEGTVANSLKPGDVVAIKIRYKENDKRPDAVVVPNIIVSELRTSEGAVIDKSDSKKDKEQESEGSVADSSSKTPSFILFHVNNAESAELNMAKKEGTLYIVKYLDISKDKLEKTYVYGKTPKVSIKNGDIPLQTDDTTNPSEQAEPKKEN